MYRMFIPIVAGRRALSQRLRSVHKHPIGFSLLLFAGLLLAGGIVLLVLAKTHTTATFHPTTSHIVIIRHDGETQTVPTNQPTVGMLLTRLNIKIGAHDRVEPSRSTHIVQDNFRINVYRATPVTIVDGTKVTVAHASAATARSAVEQAGLKLYPEDEVAARPAGNLLAEQSFGEIITVNRAVPVTLNVYGVMLSLRTHADTVGALLHDRNVRLGKQDTVIPAASTPITKGMQIFVNRKGTQIVTETQPIAAPVQTLTDDTLSFGTTVVRQQGTPGTQVLTYQVQTVNGVETGRTLLQTVITVQPVTQIIARGQAVSIPADKQAVMRQAGIAASDFPYVDYIISHEGGWCPTKWQNEHICPGYYEPLHPENSSSYGYGIGQATPANKMAAYGSDWRTNVVTQLRWATAYASRYGGWEGAYNHWQSQIARIGHGNW